MIESSRVFKPPGKDLPQLQYLQWIPEGLGEKNWPSILFLHGKGERGHNLKLVKRHGLPALLAQRRDFPFFVLAPQCPSERDWSPLMDSLEALLAQACRDYPLDESRLYLTGLSMGGRGAWELACRQPRLFAALATVCARRPALLQEPGSLARLRDLPAWLFHGALDQVVPLSESQALYEALRPINREVRLTVYPQAGHDAWTIAYQDPELYTWFLEFQSKGLNRDKSHEPDPPWTTST